MPLVGLRREVETHPDGRRDPEYADTAVCSKAISPRVKTRRPGISCVGRVPIRWARYSLQQEYMSKGM